MNKVICSHGFGVKADARGMFTDLQMAIPSHEFVMFNYNEILSNGDVKVATIDEQAKILQAIIDQQDEDDNVLLCHSQGSIIAGLVDLTKISKVIILAPPVEMSMQRVIDKLINRPSSEINLSGVSKFQRTDGSFTFISKEYIDSVNNRNPIELYQSIADKKPTIIIRATNDQVLGPTNVGAILNATHVNIEADHDFTGDSRNSLISKLKTILN